ncbi:unnamed protein product [Macrosiphum euphorbiae]|uniref:HAT C-terminal dimerisation domain-containing protein n=1 Tax=Macrosiphum euphorbiae TaxID=13131 RepID=A0AAV0W1N1_9HEMI|nr:unnamed protein product [Macrosiphum euphorbiae]
MLTYLVPNNLIQWSETNSSSIIVKYIKDKYPFFQEVNNDLLNSELELWIQKWKKSELKGDILPKNVFDTLDACCGIIFPTIKSLISILASLPISTASAERSFSTLRRLKTWLRSRMGEHRLTGLALLHTHKDIIVNIEEVINRFANEKKRNVQLLL